VIAAAKSHVNMTADSARQVRPAATRRDRPPRHILHREGEIKKFKKRLSESVREEASG